MDHAPAVAPGVAALPVELLLQLMRRSRDALCVVDGSVAGAHRIVAVNAGFTDVTGYREDQVLGRHPLILRGPATDLAELRRLRRAMRAGTPAHGTVEAVRADGRPSWVDVDVFPAEGPEQTYVLVGRDVTVATLAAQELQRVNGLLRVAATTGGVGIWEFGDDGSAWWDATYRTVLGIGPDEPASVERGLASIHPDDREAVRADFTTGYDGTEARFRVVHPDGSVHHLLTRGVALPAVGGGRRYTGTIVDITASQRQASRVVDILESISDAYIAVDHSWRITYLNRRAEQSFGVRREDVVGLHVWDEAFPQARGSVFEVLARRAMELSEPTEYEAHNDGTGHWLELHCYPVPDGLAAYVRDITDRNAAERERSLRLQAEQTARLAAETAQVELAHQATHDALTGLANRPELTRRVGLALAAQHDHPEGAVVVLFLDLDRFKLVNDTLGHAAGDELLVVVGGRLADLLRPHDVVARIGGDEFVVALLGATPALVAQVVQRLLDGIRLPVDVQSHQLTVTASVGVCLSTPGCTAETMLRDADVALYRAKDAGRDQAAWFDTVTRESVVRRVRTEADLRRALEDGELRLVYQPSFDLGTGRATGAEALLRWQHPERGMLAPGEFIPVAEDSGLIVPVGDWVVATACAEAGSWVREQPDRTVWVNVSLRQLRRPGLTATVAHHLGAHGLAPRQLGIEVTESALADDSTAQVELLALAALGVRLAIDDFGTGYSSLARLRTFPVDVIKIDRSFVAELGAQRSDPIVDAVIELAHALGTTTIAEGVEDTDQLGALVEAGCDEAAGYLLARPVPVDQLADAAARGSAQLT